MFFGKKELENKVVLLEDELKKLKNQLEQKDRELVDLSRKHSIELEEISKKNQTQPQSIDLHFEKLVNNPKDFESWERLMIQREKLIEKLEYCRSNNMKKRNIIHGIGDGVLQNMVHEVLQGFAGIEYEDHDFFYHSTGNVLVTFL